MIATKDRVTMATIDEKDQTQFIRALKEMGFDLNRQILIEETVQRGRYIIRQRPQEPSRKS